MGVGDFGCIKETKSINKIVTFLEKSNCEMTQQPQPENSR